MENIGIVINSQSKNAASLSGYLTAFTERNISYTIYKPSPDELNDSIKKARNRHSILLVGGGDGTIRAAAQECICSPVILGVLPLGTMNHFAKELNLPQTPDEIIKAIENKKTVQIDTAEVNGSVFVNNSSIGFYPSFAKKLDYYKKFYNKWLCYIPSLWHALKKHKAFSLTLQNRKLSRSIDTSFLMISNNLYIYEFPFSVKRINFSNAQLGIYYYKYGKMQLLQFIHYFFNKKESFEILSSKLPMEIHIHNHSQITLSLDGETMVKNTPLLYKSIPNSLTLITNNP
ncbi:diacylglycerol/lipid kinase family protein [Legionella septentrionalis]|uniref:diacylglycerol/lipid kinase family protein n=1 Tax=Legionella septentrionalis TaxID=2498109 RepID=UPI000F8C85F7|nr:diacylglycerol kinase family protein [Legionella septentrionalis]RUR16129.1 diacylglycerol kinase [Legionella septentrionalis]